jgi:hypothetical protein
LLGMAVVQGRGKLRLIGPAVVAVAVLQLS